MFHLIRFVDNDAMPAGHDFLVAHSENGFVVFVRDGAVSTETLEDAWDAYRAAWRSKPMEPKCAPLMPFELLAAPVPYGALLSVA